MNKLITTHEGGFPLKMEDLEWMQNATKDLINMVLKPFIPEGQNIFPLAGLQLDGSGNLSEGVVWHDGEVFRTNAVPYPAPGEVSGDTINIYGKITEAFDADGVKVFKDGNQHEVYAIRSIHLEWKEIDTQGEDEIDMGYSGVIAPNYLKQKFHKNIEEIVLSDKLVSEVVLSRTIGPGDLIPGTYTVTGKRMFDFIKQISGRLYVEDLNVGDTIEVLPSQWRPAQPLIVDVPVLGFDKQVRIKIQQDGHIKIERYIDGSFPAGILSVDNIVYS